MNFETFRGVYLIGNASIGVDSSHNVYLNQINYQSDIDFKIDNNKIATLSPKDSVFNIVGEACLNMQNNTIHNVNQLFTKSASIISVSGTYC